MSRIAIFLSGIILGAVAVSVTVTVALLCLPRFLVVAAEPVKADAVIILGGDGDGSRLRRGIELAEQAWAPRLILTGGKKQGWLHLAQQYCPDCRLEARKAVYLEDSVDTRTDAQLSLEHCRKGGLRKVLVVTSPYHSRRSRFVFDDIYAGGGVEPVVVSSGGYGRLIAPDGPWWRDRLTLETVWLEIGKILFWELTPFLEWQGEG